MGMMILLKANHFRLSFDVIGCSFNQYLNRSCWGFVCLGFLVFVTKLIFVCFWLWSKSEALHCYSLLMSISVLLYEFRLGGCRLTHCSSAFQCLGINYHCPMFAFVDRRLWSFQHSKYASLVLECLLNRGMTEWQHNSIRFK